MLHLPDLKGSVSTMLALVPASTGTSLQLHLVYTARLR